MAKGPEHVLGRRYHWYILASQKVANLDANTEASTPLSGAEEPIAYRAKRRKAATYQVSATAAHDPDSRISVET